MKLTTYQKRRANGSRLAHNAPIYKYEKALTGTELLWESLGRPEIIEYTENGTVLQGFFIDLIIRGQFTGDFLICDLYGTLKRIDLMQFVDLNQLP